MKLVEPSKEMEKEFITMAKDYKNGGEVLYQFALDQNFNFDEYVEGVMRQAMPEHQKPGFVPSSAYWMVNDSNEIVGTIRVRHYLVPHLELEGGHIGYDIEPSMRKKGYGTILLQLGLEKAKEIGIQKALVTCDSDNIGSSKIIRKNGGIFENEVKLPETGKLVSRYWVEIC